MRRTLIMACRTAVGCVAVAAVLAACGSSSKSSSSSSSAASATTPAGASTSTPASSPAKGSPVTIFTSTLLNTSVGNVPGIASATKAAAAAINQAGGLKGHPVKVKVCNDTDPNAEVSCAREAIADHAIGFTGSVFLYNNVVVSNLLEKAGIVNVAPVVTGTTGYASKDSFPVDPPSIGYLACPALMPKLTGDKKIAIIAQNLPTQLQSIPIVQAATKAVGGDYVGSVVVSASTTDFSTAVHQLASKGAQIVVSQISPTGIPGFLSAMTSLGQKFAICSVTSETPNSILAQLGPAVGDYYLASSFPPASASGKYPLLTTYKSQMAAEVARGDAAAGVTAGIPDDSLRAWLGMQIIKQAADSVSGALTGPKVYKAMSTMTYNSGGVIPTLHFAKQYPIAQYRRAFNPTATLLKWNTSTKTLDTTSAPRVDVVKLAVGK